MFPGSDWGLRGPRCVIKASLGIVEMDLRGGVGVGKNQVSHNMSLAIQSLATQLCWGFVGLFLVSDGGPGAPGCLN